MDIVDVVAEAQKTRVMVQVVQLCGNRRLSLGAQLGGCSASRTLASIASISVKAALSVA